MCSDQFLHVSLVARRRCHAVIEHVNSGRVVLALSLAQENGHANRSHYEAHILHPPTNTDMHQYLLSAMPLASHNFLADQQRHPPIPTAERLEISEA